MKKVMVGAFALFFLAALVFGGGVLRGSAEFYLCTPTSFTAVYDEDAEMISLEVSYEGTIQPDRTYVVMLNDANGGIITLLSCKGEELVRDMPDGKAEYSFFLAGTAFQKYGQPFSVTLKCHAPNVIMAVTAELVLVSRGDCIPGDVNCDGNVDNIDASRILRYDAGILPGISFERADVNGDGAVNNMDAAMILRYDAGLISSFGR